MGFLEFLTLVFIVLKLTGIISWGWFFVLLPLIIALSIYVLWFGVVGLIFNKARKRIKL